MCIRRLFLSLFLSLFSLAATAQEIVAVRAGRIITLAGPSIDNGTILVRNGKITVIGPVASVKIPTGATIIDASSRVVMPGLVAAYSTLGGSSDATESISPDIRAIDGYDFFTDNEKLLRGGLTTAYLATGIHRLVSGQGGVVKLGGANIASRTLADSIDVRIALGDVSKSPPPIFRPAIPPTTDNPLLPGQRQMASVRPAEFALLRQLIADARHDLAHPNDAIRTVGVGASDASLHLAERRTKLQPIESVLQGKRPLRIVANTVADIRLALQFGAGEKVRIVLEGASEGGGIAAEIAAREVPVVASTPAEIGRTVSEDLQRNTVNGKQSIANLAELIRAGVHVALMPGSSADLSDLLLLAAAQTAWGISEDAAL